MADVRPVLIDAATQREQIRQKTVDALKQAFPFKSKNYSVELHDPYVEQGSYSSQEQKKALLEGRTLAEKVKGTLVTKDTAGNVVDSVKDFTLMNLPWYTPRHTFIVDGNDYSVSNQIRTRPGVYTRRRGNEDLEASFNLSKGANFRLSMDPEQGKLNMEYGTTTIPLYPVLRALGVPHQDISNHWGAAVADMNRDSVKNQEKHVEKLYQKLIPPSKQTHATPEAKAQALNDYYNTTAMDPEVTQATLGQGFDKVTPTALLAASKKLLDVHRDSEDTDDRDSLQFKTFHSVDDFFKERIGLDARAMRLKTALKLDNAGGKIRKALPASPFTRTVNSFLNQSALSSPPTQINPLELLDQASKVTSLGEGGIQSDRAIPLEARNLHPTHFAIMDPSRTPESMKAGIDIRTAINTHRDDKGNLYAELRDVKTGRMVYLKPAEMAKTTIAFPNVDLRDKNKMVDAMVNGQPRLVRASEVTHAVPHVAGMYGPTTNLLPFLNSMQGNRIIMASKHLSQALPLVEREAPLVQVKSWDPHLTMEQQVTRMVVPTAPVAGTVEKVDDHYIYLRPNAAKTSADGHAPLYTYVADNTVDDILSGGLHSGKSLLDHPALLAAQAQARGLTPEAYEKEIRDHLATWKRYSSLGPNAVFHQIPPTQELQPNHPTKVRKLVPLKIDLDAILRDQPETRLYGMELKPYVEGVSKPGERHHYIDPSEAARLSGLTPEAYWSTYNDSEGAGRYAPDVPHVALHTPSGMVDPKYLSLADAPKTAELDLDKDIYCDFLKTGADDNDGLIKLHYDNHFPLAAKTFLHNDLKVKAGDTVSAGQPLANSNFTKDDTLALGKNLRVAYAAYHGLNTNDGMVVSQSAADKLTSEHMYKSIMLIDPDMVTGRDTHRAYFGTKYTATQYGNLDEQGAIKPGTTVQPGDPLIVALRKTQTTGNAAMLGKLSKSLVKPYREEVELWDHAHPGQVIDVVKTPSRITVTVKTRETINIGDKITNRYGGKGVIAKIVPDHQMFQDEQGRPIDVLMPPTGIITRINPAQIVEASLGKVAEKTGKPIAIENFADHDNVQFAQELLKKHGIKDKETVYDPITGKSIPDVFVGKSYILKLFKTTDTNFAAHGSDRYDINQQPGRGGDEGSKALGKMEFDGLVAHNARNVLREAASIKGQKNDEFWRAVQLGLPTPAMKTPFAYDKFLAMLQGGGINVKKDGTKLSLGPMTDSDTMKMSAGKIENARMIRAKDLQPEKGGLFDFAVTGGEGGTKWSHVDLNTPIINPVFEEPVRRLLGLTQKGLQDLHAQKGGEHIRSELAKIDIDDKLSDLRAQTKTQKGAALDNSVKQIKYLTALKSQNLTPDAAYVISKIPITPPQFRPILPQKDGRLMVGDANILYRDALLANERYGEVKDILPESELAPLRQHLYESVGAVFGTHDPVSPTAEKRGTKGFLNMITGTRPGNGFFQSKLMKRQQDVSGRATIAPDPTLGLDEIGVPEDMLWGMYGKFVIGRLVRNGVSALDAEKMVEDRTPQARQQLLIEAKERPVMVNRAPSLHRYNIIGAFPKITDGKTLRLNPFAEKGMNADYDGDALQVHAPVTQAGIEDVKKMTLSNLLFSDKLNKPLNVAPEQEAVVGLYRATKNVGAVGKPKATFASAAEALAAYHRGEVGLNDVVTINS